MKKKMAEIFALFLIVVFLIIMILVGAYVENNKWNDIFIKDGRDE